MNHYKRYEKALVGPVFKSVADLSICLKENQSKREGYIYTFYRESDCSLKIGYSADIEQVSKIYNVLGYRIVGKRYGSKTEEKAMKLTLIELGYSPKHKAESYQYSRGLMKYLLLLGWPINITNKSSYKSKGK